MPSLEDLIPPATPTADRPLAGLTLLLVEDSRVASEAMRLLCRRSGARLRRADTLEAADRHLRAYRPGAVVVDLHLPDGSGLALIERLATARPRIDAILAISGDPAQERAALDAGADAFLAKPVGLAAFQAAVLVALPPDRRPAGLRPLPAEGSMPDALALRDDLEHAAGLLSGRPARLDYVTGFLRGVARSAGDPALARAAEDTEATGLPGPLLRAVQSRLALQSAL